MRLPYVDLLESAATDFAGVIERADPSAPVPSCPGWTIGDLTEHLIGVHRWARSKATGTSEIPVDTAAPASERFRAGAAELVTALRELPEEQRCWTLYPPETVATWARRQALETAIHLWDAVDAAGGAVAIDPALAADGVAEVVEDMYPRQVRLGRQSPLDATIEFVLTDVPNTDAPNTDASGTHSSNTVRLVGATDAEKAAAVVTGAAADVLLLVWGRRGLAAANVAVSGDADAVRVMLEASLVP